MNFDKGGVFNRRWLAVVVAGLVLNRAGAPAAQDASDPSRARQEQARPDLVGRVRAGQDFPKATVFISTAGPRVGTSTFCPSSLEELRWEEETYVRRGGVGEREYTRVVGRVVGDVQGGYWVRALFVCGAI